MYNAGKEYIMFKSCNIIRAVMRQDAPLLSIHIQDVSPLQIPKCRIKIAVPATDWETDNKTWPIVVTPRRVFTL